MMSTTTLLRRSLILCLIFLGPLTTLAKPKFPVCKALLAEDSTSIPESILFSPEWLALPELNAPSDRQTVHIKKRFEAPFGRGQILLLERQTYWTSSYLVEKSTPQGDPRKFAHATTPEIAAFFGFGYINKDQILAPDYEYFQSQVETINDKRSKKIDPIAVSYYEIDGNAPLADRDFLNYWAGHCGALPMASDGILALHDLSFHTSAIFLPSKVVRQSCAQVKRILQFIEYAETQMATHTDLAFLEKKDLVKKLLRKLAVDIDYGTGNFAATLAMRDFDPEFFEQILPVHMNDIMAKGISPNERLRKIWSDLVHNTRLGDNHVEKKSLAHQLLEGFYDSQYEKWADKELHFTKVKDVNKRDQAEARAIANIISQKIDAFHELVIELNKSKEP